VDTEYNIKTGLKNSFEGAQDRNHWRALANTAMNLPVP